VTNASSSAPIPSSASDAFPFRCTERVRWEDVDLAGIVRYSAYTRMLDVAEQEMWRAAGTSAVEVVKSFELWLPRRALQIEFHAPAYFDDLLELRAGVFALGNSSVTLLVDVWSASGVTHHATIRVVLVAVTAERMAPRPIPNELRALIEPFRMQS
jgi:acyl-CoA thioester hydrolase